jgi:hypothetical protein
MESIAASPEYWEVATENDEALRKSRFAADTTMFHSSAFQCGTGPRRLGSGHFRPSQHNDDSLK